jgi:hypothetical protein
MSRQNVVRYIRPVKQWVKVAVIIWSSIVLSAAVCDVKPWSYIGIVLLIATGAVPFVKFKMWNMR